MEWKYDQNRNVTEQRGLEGKRLTLQRGRVISRQNGGVTTRRFEGKLPLKNLTKHLK